MPIVVKDFTWIQNEKAIVIRIPIRSMTHDDVDIFTTDSYIKVHFSPFIFEIFLLHDVCNDKSICVIKDDLITIDLVKKEDREWECLEKDLTKSEKMKLRQEILDKCIEKAKQDAEERNIKRSQLDRFTVQQAMEIDSKQHSLMDSRRDEQRKNAMDALEEWRLKINENGPKAIENIKEIQQQKVNSDEVLEISDSNINNSGVKVVELVDETDKTQSNPTITEVPPSAKVLETGAGDYKPPRTPKKHVKKQVKTPVKSEFVEKKKEEASKRVLPKMRESAQLEVTHTPRSFPTPSRESTADEEQAWLKNITLARRATGKYEYVPDTIDDDMTQCDSQESLDMAESQRWDSMAANIGDKETTTERDTQTTSSSFSSSSTQTNFTAIDEEKNTLANNAFGALVGHELGFVSEDLRPEEQDPQWCKEKGDEFFKNGNFLGAISAYTHGITLSDKLPSLYANRSATHFALGNFNKCMQDCSTALDLMKPACEGNRKSRAKCIARRAAALARLGYLNKGIGEMKAAAKLLPEDEKIKKDIYDMERAWEQNPDSD